MRIDPAIAALRSQITAQRHARAAMEQARENWQGSAPVAAVLSALADYGAGASLADLPALHGAVWCHAIAQELVEALVADFAQVLRSEPLGMIPFRHQLSERLAVLELARSGRAALTVLSYRPAPAGDQDTICFTSGERHEICLAGAAEAMKVSKWERAGTATHIACTPEAIGPGWQGVFDNATAGKIVGKVSRPLVILRLQRDARHPGPTREYRLRDGALIHESAADRRDSRRELALALLGSMGRTDTLPAIVEMSRSGPDHVRWEAIRQMLGLDSAAGIAVLAQVARDRADPLSAPAAALHARLLDTYPQLRTVREAALCPA